MRFFIRLRVETCRPFSPCDSYGQKLPQANLREPCKGRRSVIFWLQQRYSYPQPYSTISADSFQGGGRSINSNRRLRSRDRRHKHRNTHNLPGNNIHQNNSHRNRRGGSHRDDHYPRSLSYQTRRRITVVVSFSSMGPSCPHRPWS